jgi:TonB family protein
MTTDYRPQLTLALGAVAQLVRVRSMRRAFLVVATCAAVLTPARGQTGSSGVGKPSGDIAVYAIYAAKPDYPYFARTRHMVGSGVFQLHIRPDGTVSSVDTIQSIGYRELDDSATAAFSKWRFRPLRRPTKVKIPITFSLGHWVHRRAGNYFYPNP